MTFSFRQYWELLATHIRPQRGRFAGLVTLMFFSIGLQVVNPQILRFFIDAALGGGAVQTLTLAALAFIGIALMQQGISVSVTYLGESLAWTATNALRSDLARHCLNLDMSFHNNHTPGELIERIDGDVSEMANFFSQFIVTLLGNGLLMVGILAALFRENWIAGLVFTIFSGVALLALSRVRNLAVKEHKARRQAEAELFGFVEEQLTGTEDIRSSGAVTFSLRELFRLQGNIFRSDRKAHQKGWWIDNLMIAMLVLGNLLAMGSGYTLFKMGAITIGTVYLFIYYINQLEAPLWTLTRQVGNFQTIGACVERLTELKNTHPVVQDNPGRDGHLPAGPLGLAFEDVSFSYNSEETILTHLTFQVKPGKVLGLLGRTGSGKTTITRLVFRLYEPSQGQISIEGKDLRSCDLQALRQRVGMVTQEVQLFHASVRDNLTFFDSSIPDASIIAVLEDLELGDWLRGLPAGLDTELQAGGHSLSAGEAQLLAFARIFLRNPGLVILDEASSRLDPATEQRVERAIDKLLRDRTAIVIAHRLGTVERADDIMILDDGKISEFGDRASLAANPGSTFYHLLQTGMEEVLV
ncbi:MAG TPA: ABC transporter ATP-binding protein [Anaerolineaceae bacterium]|jgi:ATP-binding cassette subfamily B protein